MLFRLRELSGRIQICEPEMPRSPLSPRQADGFWRWRYRNTRDGTELLSADIYETQQDAMSGARLAYPGVQIVVVRSVPEGSGLGRMVRRVALLGLLVAVPLWLFRLWRRLRRALGGHRGRHSRTP